ncbi:TonB-dependent receptor [Hirschia litorea]|uniref:TonB-dependent receptor n=1 Tax=Hirschia litorea TaxID=1199156 RepID=A0ABW2INY4_9PROT
MPTHHREESTKQKPRQFLRAALLAGAAFSFASPAIAQDNAETTVDEQKKLDTIVITGIRSSLANALEEKRSAASLIEVINAEDIGKLPDQNLAEVLENVTGVQITRTAGVGTGVQIRGTNANRTEINGVSTVGAGSGRSGISFEDVPAAMIAAVEVTKSPEAKTIEGSVGGTINLRTIRPLDLNDRVANIRIQGEDSSLTTDGITPRVSGTYGDNWPTSVGDFGAVISLSYAEQDATAFRPRVDRDNLIASDSGAASAQNFDFLPIQFLIQDYDNYESQTTNFAGAFEWAPNDSLKFYLDGVVNDQERRQESSRIQASGISDVRDIAVPSEFETVNFGSLNGQGLGSIDAAVKGILPVDTDGLDGNLRFSGDTGSRLTESQIFRLGTEWNRGNFSGTVEIATSQSDTTRPDFSTTLNFINPNSPTNSSNENGTPFEYDLTGGSLTWGIAQGAAGGPTTAQLLDPANIVLRDVNISQDRSENSEDAFRTDISYDLSENNIFLTSIDAGYRYNKTTSLRDEITSSVGLRNMADSPTGDLFADILVAGPDNFNAADGRELFVRDFLLIDPELAASNPQAVLDTLNAAILANNAITGSTRGPISSPTSSQSAFFDIEEKTHAVYGQINFEHGILRGNAGLRYLETEIVSKGNAILDGVASPTTTTSDYQFLLPRLNLAANITENLVVRAGYGKDIRRPDFDDLSTSFTFGTSPNSSVNLGNPNLIPEEVESFDISADWYFAPSAVLSAGFFHKTRTGLFVDQNESPFEDPVTGFRDIVGPDCEDGGIFNPIADINVFGPVGRGVCVPSSQKVNGAGENTLSGIELAFQYDLSSFEDKIGWASGFGVLANFTHQEFSGGEEVWTPTSRAEAVFAANGATNVELSVSEIDLSENAYNATLYYEKYGLSARARYTWRDAYRSEDFGSTSSYPWGFPVIQEARGQLNASINYDVTEKLNIGIEAVNLTESEVSQSCVNEGALLCYQGLTDRRITFGANYNF